MEYDQKLKRANSRPPFNIALLPPKNIEVSENDVSNTSEDQSIVQFAVDAPNLLERSGIDVGQIDPLNKFKIVRAKGELKKHWHVPDDLCTTQITFPSRLIEKALRDNLRRGQNPTIQPCG